MQIDTTVNEPKSTAKDSRSLEQLYADCNFETETKSFSDFMQCQMQKQNQQILPHSLVSEDNFFLYSRGREMWTLSVDFRDRMEDLCRFQLEQSDLVQGYSLSADVTSGHGSLANILIESFIREETPKAPILLYAAESTNQFKPSVVDTNQQYKHDLFNLNQALWIGQLSKQANLVLPFNEEAMGSIQNEIIERYKGKEYLYHRSALQALVMNSVTSQVKIQKDEEYTGQRDLDSFIRDVLYSETPNIVVPSLRVPFSLTGRFT